MITVSVNIKPTKLECSRTKRGFVPIEKLLCARVHRRGKITHIFLSASDQLKDKFNTSSPSEDRARFAEPLAAFIEKMSSHAGSVTDPSAYEKQIAARLCPTMLPYEVGTQAAFDQADFNGRSLGEDVMDVMLTLAGNKPLADGVAPDRARIRGDFPYFGEPYRKAEQAGVIPVHHRADGGTGATGIAGHLHQHG
jgi:hypothetical protein